MAVTKAVMSFPPLVSLLADLGLKTLGDSQPANFGQPGLPPLTKCLLKSPPSVFGPKELWDYALVTHLNLGAGSGGVLAVVEMGDGKDGLGPDQVAPFLRDVKETTGRPVLGLACNFGCLLGRLPDPEAWLLFERLGREVRPLLDGPGLFSAGGTVALDDLAAGRCRGVNQIRVGEGILLGRDSSGTGTLPGLTQETAILWGEVLEVGDKEFPVPAVRGLDAYGREPAPVPRGRRRRAVLDLGSLAAAAEGLAPLQPGIQVAGQTFDFLVLELSGEARGLVPGDRVGFRPDYGALSQSSLNPFVHKILTS